MFLPLEVAQSRWGTRSYGQWGKQWWPADCRASCSEQKHLTLSKCLDMSWQPASHHHLAPFPFLSHWWAPDTAGLESRQAAVACLGRFRMMWRMQHLFDGERKLVSNSLTYLCSIAISWVMINQLTDVLMGPGSSGCASCAKPIWVVWRSMPQLESWWTGLPGLPRGKRLGAGFDGGWGLSLETWGSKKASGKRQWLIMVLNGY
jgi:hypothetical protein